MEHLEGQIELLEMGHAVVEHSTHNIGIAIQYCNGESGCGVRVITIIAARPSAHAKTKSEVGMRNLEMIKIVG
jgi:hypothetical protein